MLLHAGAAFSILAPDAATTLLRTTPNENVSEALWRRCVKTCVQHLHMDTPHHQHAFAP